MKIWKEFTFESAHFLPNVPEGHRCGGMHGHSYLVRLTLEGSVDESTGWLMDFADIKKRWKSLPLDHVVLNDIPGLENPTSENLARWIYDQLLGSLPGLSVEIYETRTCGAQYP